MPEVWYPGAVVNPGTNAGYRAGRNRAQLCIAHYTVGVNSAPIGLRGYFTGLIRRDGTIEQYAEFDAVTWHAGEWNIYGPGWEVEYHPNYDDAIFTDAARDACGGLVRWSHTEWGIPLVYTDSPDHRHSTSDQTGFMSHRSLVQTEQHYDYWPVEDWAAMVASPPLTTGGDMLYTLDEQTFYAYVPTVGWLGSSPPLRHSGIPYLVIDQATFDRMGAAVGGGSGGGLTETRVRKIVREEIDRPVKSTTVPIA